MPLATPSEQAALIERLQKQCTDMGSEIAVLRQQVSRLRLLPVRGCCGHCEKPTTESAPAFRPASG